MKRLASLFFFLASLCSAQTVGVIVHLKDAGMVNATASTASVSFELQNFGGEIPRCGTTSVVSQPKKTYKPDATGTVTGAVCGNDAVQPAGTWYQVCVSAQGYVTRCDNYLINTPGPWDLASATPMSQIPNIGPNQLIVQVYPCLVSTPSTTWTCTHNFNDTNVIVWVSDSNGKQIIPDSVVKTDGNTVTIGFVNPQAGSAMILHGGSVLISTDQANVVAQNATSPQTIPNAGLSALTLDTLGPNTWHYPQTASLFISSSASQNPSFAMMGDVVGAHWFSAPGGYGWNFYSDSNDASNLGTTAYNSETFRIKGILNGNGIFNVATGYQIQGSDLNFSNLAGNIATSHMNSGIGASGTTYWRGDGVWAPPGSASVYNTTLSQVGCSFPSCGTSGIALVTPNTDQNYLFNGELVLASYSGAGCSDAYLYVQIFYTDPFTAASRNTTVTLFETYGSFSSPTSYVGLPLTVPTPSYWTFSTSIRAAAHTNVQYAVLGNSSVACTATYYLAPSLVQQ